MLRCRPAYASSVFHVCVRNVCECSNASKWKRLAPRRPTIQPFTEPRISFIFLFFSQFDQATRCNHSFVSIMRLAIVAESHWDLDQMSKYKIDRRVQGISLRHSWNRMKENRLVTTIVSRVALCMSHCRRCHAHDSIYFRVTKCGSNCNKSETEDKHSLTISPSAQAFLFRNFLIFLQHSFAYCIHVFLCCVSFYIIFYGH